MTVHSWVGIRTTQARQLRVCVELESRPSCQPAPAMISSSSIMWNVSRAAAPARPFVSRRRRSWRNAAMWLRLWQRRFALRGVSEPRNSAELLLAHCVGADTIYGVSEKTLNRSLSGDQQRLFDEMCRKRLQGLPVQYILGEWTFRDIKLRMKPPVLIPRPETEELVGLVLDSLKHVELGYYQPEPPGVPAFGLSLLDAGCGSGAICLSLLHSLPTARAVAVDKSEDAVSLTRLNAMSLNLLGRCNVLHLDLTAGLAQRELAALGPFDIVVSNPPYVLSSHMHLLQPEVRWFEDWGALDGGKDGMDVLRVVLTMASEVLKDHGWLFVEVEPRHPELIAHELAKQVWPCLRLVHIHQDLSGKLRFCILRKISQDEETHGT